MKQDEIENIKKRFRLLYKECYYAKQEFFLVKKLLKTYNIESNYGEIIVTIYDGLLTSIFMKMAKVYDKSSKNDSITVYYMLNTIFSNKEFNKKDKYIIKYVKDIQEELVDNDVISKLKIIRDKVQAHLDKKYKDGMKSISEEDNMKFLELEDLVNNTYKIVKRCMEIIECCDILRDNTDILELQYDGIIKAVEKIKNE